MLSPDMDGPLAWGGIAMMGEPPACDHLLAGGSVHCLASLADQELSKVN